MYDVYTDGGCRGNGKENAIGGWAFIVYSSEGTRLGSKSGAHYGVTNNIMELRAILEALEWAISKPNRPVTISTDSAYCKNGIETWMFSWQRKGWKKADGEEPLNLQLWQQIHGAVVQYMKIHGEAPTIVKVKGHSGEPRNTEVDALVNVKMTELEMEE